MVFWGRVAVAILVAFLIGFDGRTMTAQAEQISGGVVRIGVINDATGPLADTTGPGDSLPLKWPSTISVKPIRISR